MVHTTSDYKYYFENSAIEWIEDAYKENCYNYTVGSHRFRVLNEILSSMDCTNKTAIDIGCGGGHVSTLLAKHGFAVTGVDMSANMLEIAEARRSELPKEIGQRITFINAIFDDLKTKFSDNCFDLVIAFGLIGYIQTDDEFFATTSNLLKDKGDLIVSFRNRLFNLKPTSRYFLQETTDPFIETASKEINELCQVPFTQNQIISFKHKMIEALQKDSFNQNSLSNVDTYGMTEDASPDIEPRQHTPNGVKDVSEKYSLKAQLHYGVHPHLFEPRLNTMFPPKIFNILSDTLQAFETHPASLTWSSVFITHFKKKGHSDLSLNY